MLGLVAVPYHRYREVLRWFAVSLLAYPFVLVSIHVDWGRPHHAFVPQLSGSAAELAALARCPARRCSPYLFFWQASEEVEEEVEHPSQARSRP